MIKVGINGFGRIGRLTARIILTDFQDKLELVCLNTSGRIETEGWVELFDHDTVYGKYPGKVSTRGRSSSGREDEKMVIDDRAIPVLGQREPGQIPWGKYETQAVIESTGVFRNAKDARKHLRGTVKKVVLSAPPKDDKIPMYVIGVNEDKMGKEKIISSASCTTNCCAPMVKVLDQSLGIKKALMTTVHAYTSDQNLQDGSHKDLRRARAAAVNLIPTSTGAAKATTKVYPALKDFDGLAIRVPVIVGSLVDLTFVSAKKTTVAAVNQIFQKAAERELKGILGVTEEPLVSADIIGLKLSALVDLSLTKVVKGDLVKVVAWYDNEWGYAQRLVETVLLTAP